MTLSFPTQVTTPRGPRHLLERGRLLDPLLEALDRRLITVAAPGGAGKTSLLAGLARRADRPLCWVTLDEWLCDPLELAGALALAADSVAPGTAAAVEEVLGAGASEEARLRRALVVLLRGLGSLPEGVLVLDDTHTIADDPRAAAALDQVARRLPAGWCLVLAGRRLPELSMLPAFKLEGEVYDLPAERLALTASECAGLLRALAIGEVAECFVDRILRETGGHAAAVVLRAHGSFAGVETEPVDAARPPLAEPGTELFDYLARSVFANVPLDERRLLLRCAVPRTLDEASFRLVTSPQAYPQAGADRALNLSTLAKRHAFISRESREGREGHTAVRYRMHDLFRDYLLSEARIEAPDLVARLQLALAELSEQSGNRADALYHFRESGAWSEMAAFAERSVMALRAAGRWRAIADLVDGLPAEARAADAGLELEKADALNHLNQPQEALAALARLWQWLGEPGQSLLRARALVLRGTALRCVGSLDAAVEDCRQGERLLLEVDAPVSLRARAQRLLGLALAARGDATAALAIFRQALPVFEADGDVAERSSTHDCIACALLQQGLPAAAVTHLEAARRGWSGLTNAAALALTLNNLGLAYATLGDCQEAEQVLEEAQRLAEASDQPGTAILAMLTRAELRRDQDDGHGAAERAAAALAEARASDQPYHALHALLLLADAHRLLGDTSRAETLAREASGIAQEQAGAFEQGLAALALGQVLAERPDAASGVERLRTAVELLAACAPGAELVRARLALAAALHRSGDSGGAEAQLVAAVGAGEAGQHGRLFEGFARRHPAAAAAAASRRPELGLLNASIRRQARPLGRRDDAAGVTDSGGSRARPVVTAWMLGALRVLVDGEEPDEKLWHGEKAKELLCFLLANPGVTSKSEIAAALWPETDDRTVRFAFNTTVYRLRQALYRDCLIASRDTCRLNPDGSFWLDAAEFERLTSRAALEEEERLRRLERAATLYVGPVAPALLGEWAHDLRRRCEARFERAMMDLAGFYFRRDECDRAREAAARVLALDPANEPMARILFECDLRQRGLREALRRFNQFRALAAADGVSPSEAFMRRYRQVVAGEAVVPVP